MEKTNLPNATAILVLGILSVIGCCCHWAVGFVLAIIALALASKDKKLYLENPEIYLNYANLNIGRILAIIGIVLSSIYLLMTIYVKVYVGEEAAREFMENLKLKVEHMEENQ